MHTSRKKVFKKQKSSPNHRAADFGSCVSHPITAVLYYFIKKVIKFLDNLPNISYSYTVKERRDRTMTTTVVTTKGQIVIPSKVRRRLNIKEGTRLCVIEKGSQIILQPLTGEYFEKMAGILNTKGKLTAAVLEERAKEKAAEEKKWSKS
jgi:AbrB family looped-hinge helix DNA binding protein